MSHPRRRLPGSVPVSDPDAIWKPGYDGPPPVAEPRPVGRERAPAETPDRSELGSARSRGRGVEVRQEPAEPRPAPRAAPLIDPQLVGTDPARPPERVSGPPDDDQRADREPSGTRVAMGVVAAIAAVAAFVIVDPLGIRDETSRDADPVDSAAATTQPGAADRAGADEEPSDAVLPVMTSSDRTVFAGPAERRLPAGAITLWSVDLRTDGEHRVEIVRDEVVLAMLENPGEMAGTTVRALDAATGDQRWTYAFSARPRDLTVIGSIDDIVIVEERVADGSIVVGIDLATGRPRWKSGTVADRGHVGLTGTSLIARVPSTSDVPASLIDAGTGRAVGALPAADGVPGRSDGWSTDGRGTWYTAVGGDLVEYRLADGFSGGTRVATVSDAVRPAVVDGRIVTVDEAGALAVVAPGDVAQDDRAQDDTAQGREGRRPGPGESVAGLPTPVQSLIPVSGSDAVVTAPGSFSGVTIGGDSVDVRWTRDDGAVVRAFPVAGGVLLQVATRGGAAMQLVDGLTGRTLEHLTMAPGALQSLVVAGDGFLALRTSDFGVQLSALELDGSERWSISGSTPLAVGEGLVVRANPLDDTGGEQALRVTAFGDLDDVAGS